MKRLSYRPWITLGVAALALVADAYAFVPSLPSGAIMSFGWDGMGRRAAFTSAAGRTTRSALDAAGRVLAVTNALAATNDGQVAAYTANVRNQYTQRTVPGVVGVMGEAPTNAAVLVNGLPADRVGPHFHKLVEAHNSSTAAYPELITLAGVAGGSAGPDLATWQTGRQFLARMPEVFVHDANGNLLSDGRWTNTWDAEDRLISMETLTNLPAAVPRMRLEFAYDDASRRVRKIVSVWSNEQWTAVSDRHFLWAGWNLLAEYGTQNGEGVTNSYLWGADLLGGLDSAGGVGGLLAVTRRANPDTSLPFFNGNGDVMGLIDAQTGASVAQYEFGPFGETLRATGPRAAANPFRFSTKYADAATGLLYYGFRLYSPPTGRWLSEDPLGTEGGWNLLGFSGNDPIDNVDPLGLDWRWEFTGDSTWVTVRAFRSSQGWGKGEILRPQYAWKWHPESNIPTVDSLLRELAPKGTVEASGMAYLQRGIDVGLRDCAKRYGDSLEALADPGKMAAEFAAALRSDPDAVILGMLFGNLTALWGDLNKIVDASGTKERLYQSGYALGNRGPEAAAAMLTGALLKRAKAAENARPPNLTPPGAGRTGALREALRRNGVPTSQQPSRVLPNKDKRGKVHPGRVYEYDVPAPGGGTRTVRIRDDAAGSNFGPADPQNRGPHFNDEAHNHYDYP